MEDHPIMCKFLEAVHAKDANRVEQMILDDEISLGCLMLFGEEPLKIAVANLDIDTIYVLLEYGADLEARIYSKEYILYHATEIGSVALVECVLLHEPNQKY